MRLISLVVMVFACGAAAGCGRSLRPDVVRPGAQDPDAGVPSASGGSFVPQLQFAGDVVELDPGFQPRVYRHRLFYVTPGIPLDTVPAFSVLENVRWVREGGAGTGASPGGIVFPVPTGPTAERQTFAPGTHEVVLQAPERAGGGEVTVRFRAGFDPDTWWAGPDPSRWPIDGDGHRSVEVVDWSHFTTVPPWPPDGRPYIGPDSFLYIPSVRRPVGDDFGRRTFYEIYGDRIYAHDEGETVHQNSWVVFCNGGYDKDSPYRPLVSPLDPALPPGFSGDPLSYPVLHDLRLVGSPIGFRSQWVTKLPSGMLAFSPQSLMYPNFDPNSVFRFPRLAAYDRAIFEGKAYVTVRAQDSDGLRDGSVDDPVAIADRVDAGGGTPQDRLARRKILTFYVGPPPGAPDARITRRARGSTSSRRTARLLPRAGSWHRAIDPSAPWAARLDGRRAAP